jgi:hypothetical protein
MTRKKPTRPRDLTAKQSVFVREFLACLNASEAARRAGYSAKTAHRIGQQLMAKTTIAAAIEERQRARLERLDLDADGLTRLWSTVATADAREIVQHRRDACRHCHGEGFAYQYTPAEYRRALIAHEQQRADILSKGGADIGAFPAAEGDWFDARKRPNPDCPECFGNGTPRVHVADTRDLSESAKALYAGVKEGRDGVEVKLHDQQAATEKLGRALGVFRDAPASAGPGAIESDLALRYVALMEKSREMQLKALRDRGLNDHEDES